MLDKAVIKKVELAVANATREGSCLFHAKDKNSSGYGRIKHNGKRHLAHRLVYAVQKGVIPPGKLILHSCDNRACINIEHLRIGTYSDNTNDSVARGSFIGRAVFTPADIKEIRHQRKNGSLLRELAVNFGVTLQTIHHIVKRRHYRDVL